MGVGKGHHECITGFIQEDYSADLRKIGVPTPPMNGEADQIVPCATSGPRAVELVKNATLKTYAGFRTGCPSPRPKRLTPTCWRS